MLRFTAFEGPWKTLFLLERDQLRILTDQGGEALLPLRDCLAILARLSSRSAPLEAAEFDALAVRGNAGQPNLSDDPDEEDSGAIAFGETLLLFESDSVLVLGTGATEARVPQEDLHALLDHLATTPPISSRRSLSRRMPQTPPTPYKVPLLSPSEWLVFRAVQEASTPLTITQIGGRWPSLKNSSLRGIVNRLAARQLLCAKGSGWVASEIDVAALVDRMLDHWLASHALTSTEQLKELARLLDERISRAAGLH